MISGTTGSTGSSGITGISGSLGVVRSGLPNTLSSTIMLPMLVRVAIISSNVVCPSASNNTTSEWVLQVHQSRLQLSTSSLETAILAIKAPLSSGPKRHMLLSMQRSHKSRRSLGLCLT